MKIQKRSLEVLFEVLKEVKGLKLAEARIRDSIILELAGKIDELVKSRRTVFETFCTKNEEGKPVPDDNGQFTFPTENIAEMNKELIILLDEEVEIKDESKLKEFIEKTDYEPKFGESIIIDNLLKLLDEKNTTTEEK